MAEPRRYDEQWGPLTRRRRQFFRAIRWNAKGLLGRPRRILAEMQWRLGDEIMALPIYDALHAAFPNDVLYVTTNYPDLFEKRDSIAGVNPGMDQPFDKILYLRDASRTRLRVDHYAALAGIDPPTEAPAVAVAGLPPRTLPMEVLSGHYVVLAPGASWEPKRWLADRWRELAERIVGQGMYVVVLGTQGEGLGVGIDLAGKTSVMEAAHVLRGARAAVTCDSGLMHLSLAVGAPTVALFGPTAPEVLFRPDVPNLTVVTNERDCAACWNHSMAMVEPGICPRDIDVCMGTITVDAVWHALGIASRMEDPA